MVKILNHFFDFRDFREATHVKEYNKIFGIILGWFGKSQVIVDEQAIKHYVKKEQLLACHGDRCLLPDLDRNLLLFNVLKIKEERELHIPGEFTGAEKESIEKFIADKLPQFERSGLTSQIYDSEEEPHFSIHVRQSGEKLSIYLKIEGMPFVDLLKGREKRLILHWPEAKTLGISDEELDQLKIFLKENIDKYLKATLRSPRKIARKVRGIPISFLLVPNASKKLARIILLPRSDVVPCVGRGHYKVVKQAFDLTSGEPLAKKFLPMNEREINSLLQDQEAVLKTRAERIKVVDNIEGYQQFELRADGALAQLLMIELTIEEKLDLVKSLLEALKEFHNQFHHGDIKLENILYKKMPNGSYKVFLTDFGFANKTSGFAGTADWMSPEHVMRGKNNAIPLRGRELDVWGMGLVIGSLLSGSYLPNALLKNVDDDQVQIKERIKTLTQRDMDRVISTFTRKTKDPRISKAWNIVQKMLLVDPSARLTAEDAFAAFIE